MEPALAASPEATTEHAATMSANRAWAGEKLRPSVPLSVRGRPPRRAAPEPVPGLTGGSAAGRCSPRSTPTAGTLFPPRLHGFHRHAKRDAVRARPCAGARPLTTCCAYSASKSSLWRSRAGAASAGSAPAAPGRTAPPPAPPARGTARSSTGSPSSTARPGCGPASVDGLAGGSGSGGPAAAGFCGATATRRRRLRARTRTTPRATPIANALASLMASGSPRSSTAAPPSDGSPSTPGRDADDAGGDPIGPATPRPRPAGSSPQPPASTSVRIERASCAAPQRSFFLVQVIGDGPPWIGQVARRHVEPSRRERALRGGQGLLARGGVHQVPDAVGRLPAHPVRGPRRARPRSRWPALRRSRRRRRGRSSPRRAPCPG